MLYTIVKKVVPAGRIARLESMLGAVQRPILAVAVQARVLCSIYYTFLSRSFGREHRAVVYGRLMYMRELKAPRASRYMLRRNTHRLEKGLVMRPRRDVFAIDFIRETVKCFGQAVEELVAEGLPYLGHYLFLHILVALLPGFSAALLRGKAKTGLTLDKFNAGIAGHNDKGILKIDCPPVPIG